MHADRSIRSAPACETESGRPFDEEPRLAALSRYDILDTPGEESFDRITRLAQKIFRTPTVAVGLIDGHREWFKSRRGMDFAETPRETAFCQVTLERRAPLVVPDLTLDSRFASYPLVVGPPFVRFYAGAPLLTSDGHALGALCVIDTKPRIFGEEETSILVDLAHLVIDEMELRQRINVDMLTGALSRRAFREAAEDALQRAALEAKPTSIVAIDLDNFKSVNDRHGHAFGDMVLTRSIAACMRALGPGDVIGRLGGEEFAALLPSADADAAMAAAERLRRAIAGELYHDGGRDRRVTASFGVATTPDGTSDVEALLGDADGALYLAKTLGRNRCVAAEPALPSHSGRRVLKRGRIMTDRRSGTLDCTVRRLSETGAELDLFGAASAPERFDLAIGSSAGVKRCRVVLRSERSLAVAFT